MINKIKFNHYSKSYVQKLTSLIGINHNEFKNFHKLLEKLYSIKNSGKKVLIIGNGGSASIASNVSVDFLKNCKIKFLNFNNAELITCYANDYGHENWIKECIKSYFDKGDLVILISSSGKSKNHLVAAKYCKQCKIFLTTLTGFNFNNPLSKLGNINFSVNSSNYNHIELTHNIWLLLLCDFIGKKKIN